MESGAVGMVIGGYLQEAIHRKNGAWDSRLISPKAPYGQGVWHLDVKPFIWAEDSG
jgi:hypothetical protein